MRNYITSENDKRSALTINPAKICQPIGAVYAYLGIHGCMPLVHGSQGCCSYLRMVLTRHYREPVMATTSAFYEGTAVFGGGGNLKAAINNTIAIYKPEILGICTTCVAETIGDDVSGIVEDLYHKEKVASDFPILVANTPSYVGSHITGYANAVKAMVEGVAKKKTAEPGRLNIIPGFIDPGDIREIKRLINIFDIKVNIFPDTSGVLDTPLTSKYRLYPKGGARINDIQASADACATLALGQVAANPAAKVLEQKFGVQAVSLATPIGIRETDAFIMSLADLAGKSIPVEIEDERGRLVDMMTDAHPHFHGKKVAIFGDPDVIFGLTGLVLEMGMVPVYIISGWAPESFISDLRELVSSSGLEAEIIIPGDLFTLHQKIKEQPVDLLIGNTYGKSIAHNEDIPLVRVGFPITDRANLHHFPIVGYAGAARLVERIGNTLLDRKDRDMDESHFEMIM
ncbi:MAG TPA: nitrogenase molybdenum-iron protein subunit beta [Actinobacteria bacterium]|nr:nitrogenase molybdenum-iron protein subunit beta [Actinomycetes bacterium]HEX21073.1 nitrogenase molybdenum-iron protein subunit beta [Actinomycetota bacterium]